MILRMIPGNVIFLTEESEKTMNSEYLVFDEILDEYEENVKKKAPKGKWGRKRTKENFQIWML